MGTSSAAPRLVIAADKKLRAFNLRKDGLSFRAIANQMGLPESSVTKMVHDELDRLRAETRELAYIIRDQRLAEIRSMMPKFLKGAYEGIHKDMEAVLKLMDREAKFLGLDAPTKSENTVKGGNQFDQLSLEELQIEAKRRGIQVQEAPQPAEVAGTVDQEWKRDVTNQSDGESND